MAIAVKKLDFLGGQILETVEGFSPVVVIKTVADSVLSVTESSGPTNFNVQPMANNVPVQLGNITEANAVLMLADGQLNVSVNGATPYLTKSFVSLNCVISGINVSNPSATKVVGDTLYVATTSD